LNGEDLFGYSVYLIRLSEEDGGGWMADVPELKGCLADGDNPEEALDNLKSVIETWLEVAREDGMEIPEPRTYTDSEYSGRFTLRVPRTLHRQLAQEAEMEGVSLNQFILSLISYNLGARIFNKDNGEKQTVSPRLFLQGSPGQT
jgi:antitoxin HicB